MARRFGIEVEFVGNVSELIEEIRLAGLSTRTSRHSYMGHSDTEWIVKLDGSVSGGGELVSPPLDFDDPAQREQVTTALQAMQRAGCKPDHSAGLHVHVEATDLDARKVAAVGRSFIKHEDAIYRVASSGWRTIRRAAQTYAKPIANDQKRPLSRVKTSGDLRKVWYGTAQEGYHTSSHGHASRYCGLNIHSWFLRGTVEFRVFNSTVNPSRAQFYIAMSVAMVQAARDGHTSAIGTAKPLGTMAATFVGEGDEDRARTEKKVFDSLGGFLRYAGGMSLDDLALYRRFWADSTPQRQFA